MTHCPTCTCANTQPTQHTVVKVLNTDTGEHLYNACACGTAWHALDVLTCPNGP